jgi:hypothetical protein
MHMPMCIVLCTAAAAIASYRAIMMVCLHDVSMTRIGIEDAHQEEEEPSHHHVAPEMSLPYEPSQRETWFEKLRLGKYRNRSRLLSAGIICRIVAR